MSISVIIPAYNEEQGIPHVLKDLRATLDSSNHDYELIVVDDASTDKTAAIAREYGVKVVQNPANVGYGASIIRGIMAANYETLAITDADGTYPVRDLPRLIEYIDKGFDMAIGERTGIYFRGNALKHPARLVFKYLSEFVAGTKIPDINSGLRVFKKSTVMPFLNQMSWGFSFTTSITLIYALNGKCIKYVPIEYYPRKGKSKVRFIRDTLRTAQILTETIITYNPLKIFILISFVLGLLALGALAAFIFMKDTLLLLMCFMGLASSAIVFSIGLLSILFKKKVVEKFPNTIGTKSS